MLIDILAHITTKIKTWQKFFYNICKKTILLYISHTNVI